MINGPENIKCEFNGCEKLFSSTYNIKRHVESCHKGVKPFECNICFKKFSSNQNKKEHIRLAHVYSLDNELESLKSGVIIEGEIQVPKLTYLIGKCFDPDLRPFSKLDRLYLFSDLLEKTKIPDVGEDRQIGCESVKLKGFKELSLRKRSPF